MSDITVEMIAAGAAVFEEYAGGGDYVKWRRAAVRVWVEMNRAKDGEPHTGGETFSLAYGRNMAKAAELAATAEAADQGWAARMAAAQEHGLAAPDDTRDQTEREWQEWLKTYG